MSAEVAEAADETKGDVFSASAEGSTVSVLLLAAEADVFRS